MNQFTILPSARYRHVAVIDPIADRSDRGRRPERKLAAERCLGAGSLTRLGLAPARAGGLAGSIPVQRLGDLRSHRRSHADFRKLLRAADLGSLSAVGAESPDHGPRARRRVAQSDHRRIGVRVLLSARRPAGAASRSWMSQEGGCLSRQVGSLGAGHHVLHARAATRRAGCLLATVDGQHGCRVHSPHRDRLTRGGRGSSQLALATSRVTCSSRATMSPRPSFHVTRRDRSRRALVPGVGRRFAAVASRWRRGSGPSRPSAPPTRLASADSTLPSPTPPASTRPKPLRGEPRLSERHGGEVLRQLGADHGTQQRGGLLAADRSGGARPCAELLEAR